MEFAGVVGNLRGNGGVLGIENGDGDAAGWVGIVFEIEVASDAVAALSRKAQRQGEAGERD